MQSVLRTLDRNPHDDGTAVLILEAVDDVIPAPDSRVHYLRFPIFILQDKPANGAMRLVCAYRFVPFIDSFVKRPPHEFIFVHTEGPHLLVLGQPGNRKSTAAADGKMQPSYLRWKIMMKIMIGGPEAEADYEG